MIFPAYSAYTEDKRQRKEFSQMTATYENLPKIAKIILQILFGGVIGSVYRIVRFAEGKNVVTLVAGILGFFGVGVVYWIVDLITEIGQNKIVFFAD